MKRITILILLLKLTLFGYSQSNAKSFYISTNLLAPLSGLNKNDATSNALLPIFSNMEYGFTLSGGYFKDKYFIETRLTLGQSNDYNIIPQVQLNGNFMLNNLDKKGLYLGGSIRYWDYINTYTSIQTHNISPGINIGYMWRKKSFLFDVRMNQNFAILSISSMENTKPSFDFSTSPMPNLSPVLPFFSFNIGYLIND